MSIIYDTRIKQDWPEDGYVFEVLDSESESSDSENCKYIAGSVSQDPMDYGYGSKNWVKGLSGQALDPSVRRIPCGKELHGIVADAIRDGYATGDEWQNTLDFYGVKHIDDLSEDAREQVANDLRLRRQRWKQRTLAQHYGAAPRQQGKTTVRKQAEDRLHHVGDVKSCDVALKFNTCTFMATFADFQQQLNEKFGVVMDRVNEEKVDD